MQQNSSQNCTHQLPHTKPLLVPSKQFTLRLSTDFCSRQNNQYQCSNRFSYSTLTCISRTLNINSATKFTIQTAESVLMHQQSLQSSTSMHFPTITAIYRILLLGPLPHTNLQIHSLFFNQKLST